MRREIVEAVEGMIYGIHRRHGQAGGKAVSGVLMQC